MHSLTGASQPSRLENARQLGFRRAKQFLTFAQPASASQQGQTPPRNQPMQGCSLEVTGQCWEHRRRFETAGLTGGNWLDRPPHLPAGYSSLGRVGRLWTEWFQFLKLPFFVYLFGNEPSAPL